MVSNIYPSQSCPLGSTGCPVYPYNYISPNTGLCSNGNRCPYQASHGSPAQSPSQGPRTQQQAIAQASLVQAFLAHQGAGTSGLMNLGLGSFTTNVPASLLAIKPLAPAEISVGELIGWRIWRLTPDFLLQSYAFDIRWPCDKPMESNAPVTDHGHAGIWAFKDRAPAEQKLYTRFHPCVMGSVFLWGDVIEHDNGYRAQFARVRSINLIQNGETKPYSFPYCANILTSLRRHYCPRNPSDAPLSP